MSLECFSTTGDPRLFVFDLEWLGDLSRPHETRIYSLAAVHCATQRTFSVVVDPAVSAAQLRQYHTFEGCRTVSRSWLRRQSALPLAQAFANFVRFVDECGSACPPSQTSPSGFPPGGFAAILCAHGCFRADLPVLKSALRRARVPYPPYWRFFDSLMFFRRVLPPVRSDGNTGYTLSAVARTLGVSLEKMGGRMHDALPDAKLLWAALTLYPQMYGALYFFWQTPLTTVPGVGLRSQSVLIQQGNVRSAEDLLNFALRAKQNAITPTAGRRRVTAALMKLGITRTAHVVAKWCVTGLEAYEDLAWDTINHGNSTPSTVFFP